MSSRSVFLFLSRILLPRLYENVTLDDVWHGLLGVPCDLVGGEFAWNASLGRSMPVPTTYVSSA